MSSISPQKGEGLLQDIRRGFYNLITARRPVKRLAKKALEPRNLNREQQARRETLKQKQKNRKTTKKENRELAVLNTLATARIAPPESEFSNIKEGLLYRRPKIGKRLDFLYPKNLEYPPELQPTETQGFVSIKQNYRKPLRLENLQVPNTNIPEPRNIRERTLRMVNGEERMLLRESQKMGLNRMFSWFYERAFEESTSVPNKINKEEYERLQTKIKSVLGKDPVAKRNMVDEFTTLANIFHFDSVDLLNEAIEQEETGGDREHKIVQGNNDYYISESYGHYIGRYYKLFYIEYTRLLYISEYDSYQCFPDPSNPLEYTENGNPMRQPLTTLKSNDCISLYNNIDALTEQTNTYQLQNNWMVLAPLYFPEAYAENSNVKKDLTAKYFQEASFIQDALDNWGILAMDSQLWSLFEKKYPEISIKISTYLLTNFRDKIILYLTNLKKVENFMIFDTSVEFQKGTPDFQALTVFNPFSKESQYNKDIIKAISQRKLYAVTPYMAFFMKKTVPTLWKQAFEPKGNNLAIYQTLNAHEKMAIDYIQYLRFMDVLFDSKYNFAEARNTYDDPLGDGSPTEGIIKEIIELYEEDERNHANDIAFFQSLVSRQLQPDDNPAYITSPEDITALLLKFTGPAIDFSARRNRSSALAEAMSKPLTIRAPAQPPRNKLTQIQSRLAVLKAERNNIQRNSPLYNASTKTRKNRKEVNRMYKNMMRRLGTFSRFTKNKESKNLEIKRNVAKATFNRLEALNRNIRQLEQQVAADVGKVYDQRFPQ